MEIKKAQDLWLEQKRHNAQIALSPECSKELALADKPAAAASEPAVPPQVPKRIQLLNKMG